MIKIPFFVKEELISNHKNTNLISIQKNKEIDLKNRQQDKIRKNRISQLEQKLGPLKQKSNQKQTQMIQSCITFFPLLKHTMKEVSLQCKNFISVKNGFLKAHKITSNGLGDTLAKIEKLIQAVQKISELQANQFKGIKQHKHNSATSYIKQNTMIGQEQLELIAKVLTQIAKNIQLTVTLSSPIPEGTFSSIFPFLIQQNLFMTRIRFHFYTFLTKVDLKDLSNLKEAVQGAVVKSVKCCQDQWTEFMIVWKSVSEKEHDLKSFEQLNRISDQYKSYLLRIFAAFYQLIYNISQPSPLTFTNFILLSNTLITYQLPKPNLSHKISQKLAQQTEKKGFWLFTRNSTISSTKENLTSLSSQDVSLSMAKKKYEWENGSESIEERYCKSRKQPECRENIVKNAQNGQNNEQSNQKGNQSFLTKDQIEVVQFYRNSLIQKLFTLQQEHLQCGLYKQLIFDLLKSYSFKNQTHASKPSTNTLIEQVFMKIIYKDQNFKHTNQSQQNSEQPHSVPYQKLLVRSNTFLEHIHTYLSTFHPVSCPSLLEFTINLYEKITIAHRNFVENETASMIEFDGKNSFSSKASAVQGMSAETENNFQVLYRINITTICILAQLYEVPATGPDYSDKLGSFNTLLTLHQVSFNQMNFPNNFSVFENPSLQNSSNNDFSTPSYQEYIKSLTYLNSLLIKAHEKTYKDLELQMVRLNQVPQLTEKMVKVEALSTRQKKSQQYEEHEDFILSYQNIIVDSLDEISNELEECFFNYYEKNKQSLLQPTSQRFTYFKQISKNILNYISCLMMIIYRKNHGNTEDKQDFIPLKNNVMTSLKLIKVLEKFLVMFWQEIWEMDRWNQNSENPQKDPMFLYLNELFGNLLKLMHKFSIPKENESLDYRYLKSALATAPLLHCYEVKVYQISQNPEYLPYLIRSKQFMKILFQTIQRFSLPQLKIQASSNLQTKTKLNDQVIQKMISIFSLESKSYLSSSIINHHFSLLVQMLFDNFSRIKEKFEDLLVNGIGEEIFAFRLVGKNLKELSEGLFSFEGSQKKYRLEEKELEKITVIVEMYLTDQNYNIDLEVSQQTVSIFQTISQIQSSAKTVFYEMVNFLMFSSLLSREKYEKVINMIMESKFLATDYLAFLKKNIISVKELASCQDKVKKMNLKSYLKLSIEIYYKIMKIFLLNHDKNDKSEQITGTVMMASAIFHQLLSFPQFIQNIDAQELFSLQNIKTSLRSNRIFNTFELEVKIAEYFCLRKQSLKNNFQAIVNTLEYVFEEITVLASKQICIDHKNFWHVNKMVADIKNDNFISNLLAISSQAKKLNLDLDQLHPSKLVQSINTSFINFSQTFTSNSHHHQKTISNLTALQTPKFTLQQAQFGSKKDFKTEKLIKKQSNFELELTQEVDQDDFETSGKFPQGGQLNFMKTEGQEESDDSDKSEQDKQENRELIVSQLEIPQETIDEKSEDFVGSTREIDDDEKQTGQLNGESYFICSKVTAINLYQEFYLNLVRQLGESIQTISENTDLNEEFKSIVTDILEMFNQIEEFHQSAANKLNSSDAEFIELTKCHLRIIYAFCNEQSWKQFEVNDEIQETLGKIIHRYKERISQCSDEELIGLIDQYYSLQMIVNSEENDSQTDQQIDQEKSKQYKMQSLLKQLQKIKLSFKSNSDTTECTQIFQQIREQLINFILSEYESNSFSIQKHERKLSFCPEAFEIKSNLMNLLDCISTLLIVITQEENLSQEKIQFYRFVYSTIQPVLIQCMDASALTKTIKQIFKQNLKFTAKIKSENA